MRIHSAFSLPLLGLALALLLGLGLAAPSAAQPTKDTVTYKISNVVDVRTRSAIAATGADVFEVGHDYVLVEATSREARALKRLGLQLVRFRTQKDFLEAFPAADSAYHDYAEMVAELQQAAFDHPAIFSLFSIGLSHDGRTIWAGKISDFSNGDWSGGKNASLRSESPSPEGAAAPGARCPTRAMKMFDFGGWVWRSRAQLGGISSLDVHAATVFAVDEIATLGIVPEPPPQGMGVPSNNGEKKTIF